MLKFAAKVLQFLHLKDFSGGINTDTEASMKELLQCKNLYIDAKGRPRIRGGSKILNPSAPIGARDISVWGYLLGYEEGASSYEADFIAAATVTSSSEQASYPDGNVKDNNGSTYWLPTEDKVAAATLSASSAAVGHAATAANDGNLTTYWEAVKT